MCQAVSCQAHRGATVFSVASPVLTSRGDVMWSQQAEKSLSISLHVINASVPHNWFAVFRLAQGLCSSWLHSSGWISTCCIWGSWERRVCLSSISRSHWLFKHTGTRSLQECSINTFNCRITGYTYLKLQHPENDSYFNECFREILILAYGHFRGCRFWRSLSLQQLG